MNPRLLPMLLALPGLLLAACAARDPEVGNTPRIGDTVTVRNTPDPARLPLPQQAQPAPADPDAAIENYRALLALEPEGDKRTESMRRLADLQVQQEDIRGNDQGSEAALRESVRLYRELLEARPRDPKHDQVYYQLARAYQNLGETAAAVDTLAELVRRHPDSPLAGDARFRRAELLFFLNRHAEALDEYRRVMALGMGGPFFDASEYKSGWAHYKLGQYEEAIGVFFTLLARDLPDGELFAVDTAIAGVSRQRADFVREALRVTSLSFTRLGGGRAINRYLQRRGDPRFHALLYNALGEQLREQGRHAEAAEVYAAYVSRYPRQPRAAQMQDQVIAAYQAAGEAQAVIREKERYAQSFAPGSGYWGGQTASAAVLERLRVHLDDLARHFLARAQRAEGASAQADFTAASLWYQRLLEFYPQDPRAAETHFLLAEALAGAGRSEAAAEAYTRTAYDYPAHPRAADAAYAALLIEQGLAEARPGADALRVPVDAGKRFAARFPAHPQVAPVLTLTAENLYRMKAYAEALEVAGQVLARPEGGDRQLRRAAWRVSADAHFALAAYAQAEAAYSQELTLLTGNAPERTELSELLAASIYRQGETARAGGDLAQAAFHFLRVSRQVPDSRIAATADYDGAASLYDQKNWGAAAAALESFRTRYPAHPLLADADKKLAIAYQQANQAQPA
ncbi:MAG: tetratricopeptide repeat protein, partial [Gammaproteobacteria bacterium]